MAKKTGLGDNPLDWIADTTRKVGPKAKPKSKPRKRSEVQKPIASEVREFRSSKVPKYETFEVKLSILLRGEQLELLEKLTREIMTHRDSDYKKERITKNTLLRAYLDVFRTLSFNTKNIPDEEELRRRIEASIRKGREV